MTIKRSELIRGGVAAAVLALVAVAVPGGTGRAAAAQDAGGATAPGTISTVAGGVGGPGRATTVALSYNCGVSAHDGSLYAGTGGFEYRPFSGAVRRISPAGQLTTLIGTGAAGPGGRAPLATAAGADACGSVTDGHGNLIITNGLRVQVIAKTTGRFYGQNMTAGHLYTVAGDGKERKPTSGTVAIQTPLTGPTDVIIDDGNLVISDSGFSTPRGAAAATPCCRRSRSGPARSSGRP